MPFFKNAFGEWHGWVSTVAWFGMMWLMIIIGWFVMTGCTLKLASPAPPSPPRAGSPISESTDQADWVWALGYPVLLAVVGWLKRRQMTERKERNKIARCAKLLIAAIEGADKEGANVELVKAKVAKLRDPWIDGTVNRMFPSPPPLPPPAKVRSKS